MLQTALARPRRDAPGPRLRGRGVMLPCAPSTQRGDIEMVRAALVQFSGHESKDVNIRKAEDLARQAAGNGARIICFPELCTTIYFCFDRDRKWFETAEPVPGPAVDRLARVARETGT